MMAAAVEGIKRETEAQDQWEIVRYGSVSIFRTFYNIKFALPLNSGFETISPRAVHSWSISRVSTIP